MAAKLAAGSEAEMAVLSFGFRLQSAGELRGCPAHVTGKRQTPSIRRVSSGDVVSIGVPANRPVDNRVGDNLKFQGRLTTDGGRLGVRIEHACDASGRARMTRMNDVDCTTGEPALRRTQPALAGKISSAELA